MIHPGTTGMDHLDALVGELIADRDRHASLCEHRLKLLDQARRREDDLRHKWNRDRLLTKVEAVAWLSDGTLPDGFRERVKYFVESYECLNCDGQETASDINGRWYCPDCYLGDPI